VEGRWGSREQKAVSMEYAAKGVKRKVKSESKGTKESIEMSLYCDEFSSAPSLWKNSKNPQVLLRL
jgi:hypothetical protein